MQVHARVGRHWSAGLPQQHDHSARDGPMRAAPHQGGEAAAWLLCACCCETIEAGAVGSPGEASAAPHTETARGPQPLNCSFRLVTTMLTAGSQGSLLGLLMQPDQHRRISQFAEAAPSVAQHSKCKHLNILPPLWARHHCMGSSPSSSCFASVPSSPSPSPSGCASPFALAGLAAAPSCFSPALRKRGTCTRPRPRTHQHFQHKQPAHSPLA